MASKHLCPKRFSIRVSGEQNACIKCAVTLLANRSTPISEKANILGYLSNWAGSIAESIVPITALLPAVSVRHSRANILHSDSRGQVCREYCCSDTLISSSFEALYISLVSSPHFNREQLLHALDEQALLASGDCQQIARLTRLLVLLLAEQVFYH